MRIAVVFKDRCQPKKCNEECIGYCPKVRTGNETIVMSPTGIPIISEELCVGCGICVHKCRFSAIKIINLSEELREEVVHQFGKNGFRLYRLPIPKKNVVVGLLGPNGIGKTTAVNILSGNLIPNLGKYDEKLSWKDVAARFSKIELGGYFLKIANRDIKTVLKPQYIDKIHYEGKVIDLLETVSDSHDNIDKIVEKLDLKNFIDYDIKLLSGGELQRVVIAAVLLKDADIYFFDEPTSYLDLAQRLRIAKVIKELAERKQVIIIEHDLAVLDFLADVVYLMYGEEGAYGVVGNVRSVRNAINTYLSGFMREENIRFRDKEIRFDVRPPKKDWGGEDLIVFNKLKKKFENFELMVSGGKIRKGEVVGVVGHNATGKTVFIKLLAGIEEPTEGKVDKKCRVSYKPQYLKPDFDGTVKEMYDTLLKDSDIDFFSAEIEGALSLETLHNKNVKELSGGELQKVAVGLCLSYDADVYLIDEPSAYLDSNQRMEVGKIIRRVIEKRGKSALVVDHDIYFIDLVSDSIMVFSGIPSKRGNGEGPYDMRKSMNLFLMSVGITFRRDVETNRPRINKPNSVYDRIQKEKGEYYYV